MPLHRRFLCVCLSLIWAADLAISQEPSQSSFEVHIERVPEGTQVVVDGELDEPLWAQAARLGALVATEPIDGAEPTHPTDVRMAYDSENLYVGVVCHDDPSDVRALQRQRDAFVRYDDVIEMWFDTFDDQRFAFWFQISAGGSRGDALLSDSGSAFNKDWDGIWYARTKTTDGGWQAEIVLPLKTLAFDVEAARWGFNLRRKRIANGEEARWANPSVAYRFFSLEEGGAVVGLSGLEQGRGLDVVPYVKSGYRQDRSVPETLTSADMGLDITWRPTPAMNLRLTTNTDFAETEIDDRQVNLTRFPLFFPEKRDFFLEDVGVFQFGPSSSRYSRGGGSRGGGLIAFYSRNIGRNSETGSALPLLAGLKLTGRAGDWNVGILETLQDSTVLEDRDVSKQNLGVVRLSRNLGGENAAGVLFTHGRPDGEGDAMTAGADFRLGSSRFFGAGHSGSLWGYFLASENDGAESANAFGLKANARSATWDHTLDVTRIEDGFDPKLGFVRRAGVDHHRYRAEFTRRGTEGDLFRSVRASISPHYDQDRIGDEDLLQVPLKWLDLEFWSEDSISIETKREFDVLDTGFDLSDDIFVDSGEFAMTRHTLQLDSNERRGLMGYMQVEWGDYYSGDILRTRISPVLLPSALFKWSLSFDDIRIDLDEGNLHTQVVSTDADFYFDPDLSWQNTAQFDTASEDLSFQSRLHWIVEPGQDMYVVALSGWDRTGRESFARTAGEVALKLTYTWRF
jgi:hypothetical protein